VADPIGGIRFGNDHPASYAVRALRCVPAPRRRLHGTMLAMTRRLPAPWRSEKIPGGYVVRDANGQTLAYVYSRATETDAMQAKVLTEDEARRVAANIARLPELLGRKE
jgi:hypothetical protein